MQISQWGCLEKAVHIPAHLNEDLSGSLQLFFGTQHEYPVHFLPMNFSLFKIISDNSLAAE